MGLHKNKYLCCKGIFNTLIKKQKAYQIILLRSNKSGSILFR